MGVARLNGAIMHEDAYDRVSLHIWLRATATLEKCSDGITHALLAPADRRTVRCHALLCANARVSLVPCECCDVHVWVGIMVCHAVSERVNRCGDVSRHVYTVAAHTHA